MSSASTSYVYLAPKPKSSYKQLVITGRNIFARTLYGRYMSAEEADDHRGDCRGL